MPEFQEDSEEHQYLSLPWLKSSSSEFFNFIAVNIDDCFKLPQFD